MSRRAGAISLRSTVFLVAAISSGAWATAALSASNDEGWSYAESKIFLKLKHNDGELGLLAEIEGDGWHRLSIDGPGKDRLLDIQIKGRLKTQGLSELVIETTGQSANEPPTKGMFGRFPQGEYSIGGMTIDGKKLSSNSTLSHVMPAPPGNLMVSGQRVPMDCDKGPIPMASVPVTISWDPVTRSHPKIGKSGAVEIREYELEIERRRPTKQEIKVELTSATTSFQVPSSFFANASGETYKLKIEVIESSGNTTEFESCLEVKS